MPHARARHILAEFLKRLRFARIVSVQGARQVGKSFFVREIVASKLPKCECVSLDRIRDRDYARSNPESFLASFDGRPLIVDEAQKAPELFDSIKWMVDENPRPGQFVLLGSTEFSRELQIRESLTGRLSRVRLFSLNLAEAEGHTLKAKPFSLLSEKASLSRSSVMRHLKKGGFPGLFAVHDQSLVREALSDWTRLLIERDLLQFPKIKVDSDLAMRIFSLLATIEEPNNANLAKAARCSARTSQKILDLLTILFAVHKLNPHSLGTGKPLYFYCDVGLAEYFGASFERKLWTWALHEQLSQRSYRGDRDTEVTYFRNSKGNVIHLVLENGKQIVPIKIIDTERWDSRHYEILKAFEKRTKKPVALTALASEGLQMKNPWITVFPYEALV